MAERKKTDWVWVLNWRYELEDSAQQTELVETAVFRHVNDAVTHALRIQREQRRAWRDLEPGEEMKLCIALKYGQNYGRCAARSYLMRLSDCDNLVFELSRQNVVEKGRVKRGKRR